MNKKWCAICAFACLIQLSPAVFAQTRPTQPLRLWSGEAPGALGKDDKDIPTLTPYWPEEGKATGASFIVCPGGGYNNLAAHEGEPFARWLNTLGITAFVLKYRLVPGGYRVSTIYLDAARAVRTVRANGDAWKLDPKRIGIIGSSAGGHLSATLLTVNDAGKPESADPIERVSSRPDLGVLCYAFILFDRGDNTSRYERFLGTTTPTPEQIRTLSPALNASKGTPPCFIWQTVEDASVVVENALVFTDALRKAGVPFDLHLYEKGRHGIGLGTRDGDVAKMHPWTKACATWLQTQGFAKTQ